MAELFGASSDKLSEKLWRKASRAFPGRVCGINQVYWSLSLEDCSQWYPQRWPGQRVTTGHTLPDGAAKRAMGYIVARSYAIYLIHIAICRVTRELWMHLAPHAQIDGTYNLRFAITAIPAVLALAEINYHFIETLSRRHGAMRCKSLGGSP